MYAKYSKFSKKSARYKDFYKGTIRYKTLKKGIIARFYIAISLITILKLYN